jgi:hypothetical protein
LSIEQLSGHWVDCDHRSPTTQRNVHETRAVLDEPPWFVAWLERDR